MGTVSEEIEFISCRFIYYPSKLIYVFEDNSLIKDYKWIKTEVDILHATLKTLPQILETGENFFVLNKLHGTLLYANFSFYVCITNDQLNPLLRFHPVMTSKYRSECFICII